MIIDRQRDFSLSWERNVRVAASERWADARFAVSAHGECSSRSSFRGERAEPCSAAADGAPPCLPFAPTARRPQRQGDEHRLEEEANQSLCVGDQTEGIDVVEILIEIAREDEHIEEGEEGTHLGFVAEGEEHGESECDFDHTRGHDDKVGEAVAETEPHGHLRHEGKAVESEVTEAGVGHEDTEQQAEEGFYVVHCAMKIVEVEYL